MKNPLSIFMGILAVASSALEAHFNLTYPHHKGPCPQDLVARLPLTLAYNGSIVEGLWLTDVLTEEVSLSEPLPFCKEGIDGVNAFMSIGGTDLNVQEKAYPLSQLWVEEYSIGSCSSAFYVDKNKTCLIMHDLAAADNPLAIPRF